MKNARLVSLILALGLATLIAGCGNKGDLVRPEPKADAGAAQ
jgi:predicted small lipoprotein YifL